VRHGGYMMRPKARLFTRYDEDKRPSGGELLLGPIQFNWGFGNGAMPRGLRIHLTWPRMKSLYLWSGR
jgi:hypothetical protein